MTKSEEVLRTALEKIAGRPGKRIICSPESDFAGIYERIADKALAEADRLGKGERN